MKQITATNPQTTAVYRFDGKDIYIKVNNEFDAQQLIQGIISKGGKVQKGKGWLKVDIFGENTYIKLGNIEIDLTIVNDLELETILCNFYRTFLEGQNFKCEVTNV